MPSCYRKRNAKMQKELEDAAKDMKGVSPDSFKESGPVYSLNAIPTKPYIHFVSIKLFFFTLIDESNHATRLKQDKILLNFVTFSNRYHIIQ